MTERQLPTLSRCRIMVVEDEYMIATEVAEVLSSAGATVLGPVPGLDAAFRLLTDELQVDAALVDVNLGGRTVWPLVDTLLRRGVPLLLATGYDADAIPPTYAALPRHEKPATGPDLVRSLVRLLDGGCAT